MVIPPVCFVSQLNCNMGFPIRHFFFILYCNTSIVNLQPLFTNLEKMQNEKIDQILKSCGHQTYLPQRDGGCFAELPDFIDGVPKAIVIHQKDIEALNWCDTILFVFDGRVPDEGACFELGYAYAKEKRCIGFKTDSRSLICGFDNLMLTVSVERVLHDEEELKCFFKQNNAYSGQRG